MILSSVQIAVLLPATVFLGCYFLFGQNDPIILFLFFACACSFTALALHMRSNYLANIYVRERRQRSRYTTSCMSSAGGGGSHRGMSRDSQEDAAVNDNEERRPPRTVARVAPVYPAALSLLYVAAAGVSTITAAVIGISQIYGEVTR